uniref:muscarinic acetylcholine receptor M4-like n=1 Tax=Myxine glutinosa TaxID=7769 RepID=UPI00358EE7A2
MEEMAYGTNITTDNVSAILAGGGSSPNKLKTFEVVFIIIVTGSLSLVTVVSNVLVMVSIRVNRHLQTVNNYFLFSLACADCIIGAFSMNLYTVYIVASRWPLGPIVCDLWLALDYVASNASVMNLLIISFDRYFCVTKPLSYPARRTTRMAGFMIAGAWILSLVLWAPAILFWQYLAGKRTVPMGECYIQFLTNPVATFGTAIAAFYLPVAIMIVLYAQISVASKSRVRVHRRSRRSLGSAAGGRFAFLIRFRLMGSGDLKGTASAPVDTLASKLGSGGAFNGSAAAQEIAGESVVPEECEALTVSGAKMEDKELSNESTTSQSLVKKDEDAQCHDPNEPLAETAAVDSALRRSEASNTTCLSEIELIPEALPILSPPEEGDLTKPLQVKPVAPAHIKRKRHSMAREKKVTRTIFAILMAFIITWTPYNVMVLVATFCSSCMPETVWTIGYWLCYINSTINPVCYALCNTTFKKTFKHLLLCQYKNIGSAR